MTRAFTPPCQAMLLWNSAHAAPNCLRGCHALSRRLPTVFGYEHSVKRRSEHHIRAPVAGRRSVCPDPLSLALLTESLLISVPPRTKIFQFRGCSHLSVQFGYLLVLSLDAAPQGFSQLPAPFFVIRTQSSTEWHKASSLYYSNAPAILLMQMNYKASLHLHNLITAQLRNTHFARKGD